MSNTINIGNGITLTLSDATMHLIFGELLTSAVSHLQTRVAFLENAHQRLLTKMQATDTALADVDNTLESLQTDLNDLDSKVDDLDSKVQDMPDFDEMAGQIEELESNVNADSIGEMESSIEALQLKASKLDNDMDSVNGIFSAIVSAIHSKVLA
jgi:chromosome segregation ATPase